MASTALCLALTQTRITNTANGTAKIAVDVGVALDDSQTIVSLRLPFIASSGLARPLGNIAARSASAGLPAMALPLLLQHFQARIQ